MKLSKFGKKFAGDSGIVNLMDDLGTALNENPDMIFMGGGNPGRVPGMEAIFGERLEAILDNPELRHSLFGIYQSPQGDREFRRAIAAFLRRQYGWQLGEENIAVSNGSQSTFFLLFNMLAGEMADGTQRQVHLPLAPEYIGYGDTGLCDGFFTATRPNIELLDNQQFKYHVDFSHLELGSSTAALCVSRPTNPTGNVLTDDEIAHLDDIARSQDIPLIIDGAYGQPFPEIVFVDAKPHWNDNTILALSLSKLGLPGVRTGILVAREDLIEAFTNANTIASLACGTLGPLLTRTLFEGGQLHQLSRQHITPFYHARALQTVEFCHKHFDDIPWRVHKPEGAIFLWLWFEGLPITSQALYQRLKQRGVLVVPGHNFFVGMDDGWRHRDECLRVSYAMDSNTVEQGITIIGEEVRRAYNEG